MAAAPTAPLPAPPERTWGQVFKDGAMLITLIVTFQFFILILVFSQYPSQMAVEAKGIILQTYVVAFSACWGYWLGSSASSKSKDQTIAAIKETKNGPPTPTAN